jgi:hypothetical protein
MQLKEFEIQSKTFTLLARAWEVEIQYCIWPELYRSSQFLTHQLFFLALSSYRDFTFSSSVLILIEMSYQEKK